jgi:hypothetical protein
MNTKSKLKTLIDEIVTHIFGDGVQTSYIESLAAQVEEIIKHERTEMPQTFGYTRERSLIGRCRWACDDYLPGAILVNHVLGRFGKKKSGLVDLHGSSWICQTRDWWCFELNLSRHEYDRALRIAKKNNLLDVEHAKLSPNGLPMTLIKPTDKARLLYVSLIAAVKDAKATKKLMADAS